MSQLEQYPVTVLEGIDGDIAPGALVRHVDWPQSWGTVISVVYADYVPHQETPPATVLVLWSTGPGLFGVRLPPIRRVNYQAIAKQLVSIQPMTAPAGSIFYLDYQYGSGSLPTSGSV